MANVTSRTFLTVALLLLVIPSATPASDVPEEHVYREVDGEPLTAYVFHPPGHETGDAGPAILLFHGGGWSVGSPEWTFASARRFASRGMVAVSVEYRLSGGEATPVDALADTCAAFRWVRRNAKDLGVDPDKRADGIAKHLRFLERLGFIGE